MTTYTVHLHRDIRLTFEGIVADSPKFALRIAQEGDISDADDIEDCGEDLSARVEIDGEAAAEPALMIDFEPERQRQAARSLLVACRMVVERWERGDLAEAARACSAAIAEADDAGIASGPPAPAEYDHD